VRLGIEAIKKKQKTYFAKFFELSSINEAIKKLCIRIFLNFANNIPDCYDKIEKAAINYARETESTPFQTLIQGLGFNDTAMAIAILKLVNQLIFNAGEETKQGKFIAKLESLGIFDLLQKWGESDNEDILSQIQVFNIYMEKVASNIEYQLEVYKNRNKDLDLHCKVLERKVEYYREQQSMFKVMVNDLENYRIKANMCKEFATLFDPFFPINEYTKQELTNQDQVRDNIIDVEAGMAKKDKETIKRLEKELQHL
jgi:hypothetical protein